MLASDFHLLVGWKPIAVRIERTGGHLDHFYHFIMDFAWPLHHWAEKAWGGWQRVHAIRSFDRRCHHFAGHFESMLGKRLRRPDLITSLLRTSGLSGTVTLTGFNSRVRDHERTFASREEFRASLETFVAHIARSTGADAVENLGPAVILIERAPAADHRGASRRSIKGHADLAAVLRERCDRDGSVFRNVRLEELSFPDQFRLFHRSRAVIIGQHGAGLLAGLWSSSAGAVIELAAADNPTHFENLYADLGRQYQRVVLPGDGVYGGRQELNAGPEAVIAAMEDAMRAMRAQRSSAAPAG